ncbi:MAG: 4Fe-4S binding protein [Clostridiales bacterium]|jgi:carbon-monoxide dehydrogenase iron sulfur subunit|nr:4Fe-4S binding protein [Clostridiales bacterium]
MRRIYVNEEWCLGCHLCEYYCAFAQTGGASMALALKDKQINPRIHIEDAEKYDSKGAEVHFAVSCRHCVEPYCVKGCITGALSIKDGVIQIDQEKCIGCYTCVLSCPYGCVAPADDGKVMQKCELCLNTTSGEPQCAKNCPNAAIVYEDRG